MNRINSEQLARLRATYAPGIRVELVRMDDPYTTLRPGDKGTVDAVDDAGTIHVNWDNGSTLGVAFGEDSCRKLPPEKAQISVK